MIIFFFSDISWYGLYQRPHHLAKRFAKYHTVIWVEPITLSHKLHLNLHFIDNNLYSVTLPTIPYNARNKFIKKLSLLLDSFKIFRTIIQIFQKTLIRRILKKLSLNPNCDIKYIFFFENYQFSPILRYFKPRLIIYDYIDNALGFTTLPDHIIEIWKEMIRNSDFIITTSKNLMSQIEKYRNLDIYLVTNGVEYDFFASTQRNKLDLSLPSDKDIIGYIGAIYPWLDFELIEYLCSNLSHLNFVFIGKSHPEVTKRLHELKSYKNFYYLGMKPYSEIPKYLSNFKVGIIPFLRNQLTEGVNPVKLFEYSAAGKPTVCSNFSDDIKEYKDIIFIANDKTEFVNNILTALEKSKEIKFLQQLKNFAQQNDWNEKFKAISSIINNYLMC